MAKKDNQLFIWKETEPEDYRMWCYAGGRRYLFADCIIENGKGYKGWIYDIDLDSFRLSEHYLEGVDAEYIRSMTNDYDKAYAIADCIDHTRETKLYGSEEELWSSIRSIDG